jgi:outer membrane protein OmpA-like peptidoglycan-associated protein
MKIIFTVGLAVLITTTTLVLGQNKKNFMAFGTKIDKSYKCSHVGIQKIKKNKFKKKEVAEIRAVYNNIVTPVIASDNTQQQAVISESNQELTKTIYKTDSVTKPELPLPAPVYFRFDTDELSYADLKQIVLAVEHAKLGKLIILEGHTDFMGNDHYNHRLSLKRAYKIKAMMVDLGVDANVISVIGHGETKPATVEISDSHRQLNRRVEFVVLQKN